MARTNANAQQANDMPEDVKMEQTGEGGGDEAGKAEQKTEELVYEVDLNAEPIAGQELPINLATMQARLYGRTIRRSGWHPSLPSILPTNTYNGCMTVPMEGRRAAFRWQPKLDDLIADDWIVNPEEDGMLYGRHGTLEADESEEQGASDDA